MEIFTEPITEKEILLPKGVKYEPTYNGFILKTNSGAQFFQSGFENNLVNIGVGILSVCTLIVFSGGAGQRGELYPYLIITGFIGMLLFIIGSSMKKLKITITVSPKGIEIKAKKNSLFIEKENIKHIYASQGLSEESYDTIPTSTISLTGTKFHLNEYKVILVCKDPIKHPNYFKFKDKIDLFYSHFFYTKKSAVFFVQEFIRVLGLDLNVTFIDNKE